MEITREGGVACDWSSAGSWSAWRLVIGLWMSLFIYHRKLLEVRIFTGGMSFLAWKCFFHRIYLPLVMEVLNRLFIDCLGFMMVNKIKKHLLRLNQSKYSPRPSCIEGTSEYI